MDSDTKKMIESVFEFLKRDDLKVEYKEEVEEGFKKSEGASHIARIKTITSEDGKKLTVVFTEVYMDDAPVPYKEILAEIAQNWTKPRRVIAFLYTDEKGEARFSDKELYTAINNIWNIVG